MKKLTQGGETQRRTRELILDKKNTCCAIFEQIARYMGREIYASNERIKEEKEQRVEGFIF